MKIWFGATSLKIEDHIENYRKITQYLKENGCVVLFDWIEIAYNWAHVHSGQKRNVKGIYEEVLMAIEEADACVIEYTVPNFSSSHQIMLAIHKKKPTLVLRLHKDNIFPDSYIEALDSPYLTVKEYNLANYKEIIDEFIGYSNLEPGQGRYNIVLDKKHKYYLDWAASKYKKSRSGIIRDCLEKKMVDDVHYTKYFLKRTM